MKTALSIAGSDCSGGAGIQADLKTMTMNGVYAMCALTALTAQNTTGVSDIMEVTPAFLKAQLDMIFTDIRPDAVKTGMIPNSALIEATAERLSYYQAENLGGPGHGSHLRLQTDGIRSCRGSEAVSASSGRPCHAEHSGSGGSVGMPVRTLEDMTAAALRIEESLRLRRPPQRGTRRASRGGPPLCPRNTQVAARKIR